VKQNPDPQNQNRSSNWKWNEIKEGKRKSVLRYREQTEISHKQDYGVRKEEDLGGGREMRKKWIFLIKTLRVSG